MISVEDILKMSSYFSTIHHSAGRLRVKIDRSIVNDIKNVSLNDITNLPQQINGLKEVKVNKIMATATIIYDASIFSSKLWDDAISGENLDEVSDILNQLQTKLKED